MQPDFQIQDQFLLLDKYHSATSITSNDYEYNDNESLTVSIFYDKALPTPKELAVSNHGQEFISDHNTTQNDTSIESDTIRNLKQEFMKDIRQSIGQDSLGSDVKINISKDIIEQMKQEVLQDIKQELKQNLKKEVISSLGSSNNEKKLCFNNFIPWAS